MHYSLLIVSELYWNLSASDNRESKFDETQQYKPSIRLLSEMSNLEALINLCANASYLDRKPTSMKQVVHIVLLDSLGNVPPSFRIFDDCEDAQRYGIFRNNNHQDDYLPA